MGYAKIVAGGPKGRYTIEIDFGKAARDAAVASIAAFINKTQIDIGKTLAKIAAEDAKLAPQRAAYTAAVDDYILAAETLRLTGALPPGTPTLSTATIDFWAAAIKRTMAAAGPLRRRLDALRFLLKTAQSDIARRNSIVATSTRDAWCVNYIEDAPVGSYVATCEIPGDSNHVLIAPDCRAWQPGDGTIDPGVKAFILGGLNARLAKVQAEITAVVAKLTAATVDETALKAASAAAHAAFVANPSTDSVRDVAAADKALSDKRSEIVKIRTGLASITARYVSGQKKIAAWAARPTSSSPVSGDGRLTARGVMTPEQAFWTESVLPGWQKWLPTYRWGTVTAINLDGAKLDVDLAPTRSTAQGLDVNQTASLSDVPVDYMDTGAAVFEIGDRVVVQFMQQDWKKPRVIGFVDNPKPGGRWEVYRAAKFSGGIEGDTDLMLRMLTGGPLSFNDFLAAGQDGTMTADYRVNRGAWIELNRYFNPSFSAVTFYADLLGQINVLDMDVGVVLGSSGGHLFFSANDAVETMLVSPGDIIESRIFISGKLVFNAAIRALVSPPVQIAIVGKLRNDIFNNPPPDYQVADALPMKRLSYSLYQTSGT